MQLAKSIQHTLLPNEIPQLEGYDIGAKYEAAMEVGGDYYDFFDVGKNSLGVAVGDVSGKGIGGALVMTMTRTALRLEARGNYDAATVLGNLNATFDGEFKKGMYITMFYLVLDAKRRAINFASAGHNPMIFYRGDTQQFFHFNPKGFAVGLNLGTPDIFRKAIKSESIRLKKGDLLFVYTDGITEAMNAKREEYGEYRLLNAIRNHHALPAQELSDQILRDIDDFTGGHPQSDDITFVIIKEKADVTEIEEEKRRKLFDMIETQGLSVNKACKTTGISRSKYLQLKSARDQAGTEAPKTEVAVDDRNIDRLDIEASRRLLSIVAQHPDYGVRELQNALREDARDRVKAETKLIVRELTRLNLTTAEKRQRFAKREAASARSGRRSVFMRSGASSDAPKPAPEPKAPDPTDSTRT
jgi:transposase